MFDFKRSIKITVDDYIYFNTSHYSKFRMKVQYVWLAVALVTIFALIGVLATEDRYNRIPPCLFLFLSIVLLSTVLVWVAYFILKYLYLDG